MAQHRARHQRMKLLLLFLASYTAVCASMKECIDPIRSTIEESEELQCDVAASVPEPICHTKNNDPESGCNNLSSEGSTVCAFVAEALFAEWKVLDAVFLPSGTCQAGISNGRFTPYDAMKVLPDNHELIGVRVRGSELLAALEYGLVAYYVNGQTGAYPHTAGLKFKFDLTQPERQRIKNPKVLKFGCGWKPLNAEEEYTILTNSAVANDGKYGFDVLSERATRKMNTGIGEAEALWRYASSVCTLEDDWHRMRLRHAPEKIPIRAKQMQEERIVTSSA